MTPEFPSYATFDERSKTVTEKLLDPSQILQNVVNDEAIKSLNEDDSSLEDLLLGYSLQLEFKGMFIYLFQMYNFLINIDLVKMNLKS